MLFCPFFHIYQPPDQRPDILERIVNESYRPLISGWLANPKAFATLNINACLTEMLFRFGYSDVISGLKQLLERGQLELTASTKYHPFLPILPESEIVRQIELNEKTNRKFFGSSYRPNGFFPPEMGISSKVCKVIKQKGYKWIIMDEIAFNGKVDQVKYDRLYKTQNTLVFFRNRRVSNLVMSAMVRTSHSLKNVTDGEDKYIITAMDGETFGHHRPGLTEDFFSLYETPGIEFTTISALKFDKIEEINPISCTWATSEKEIEEGKNFYLYYNPKNKLHRLQKRLMDLAMSSPAKRGSISVSRSLSCNHMWWSNPDSWWSIEEIEKGAYNLSRCVPGRGRTSAKAQLLYRQIMDIAFGYQRSGLVQKLHLEKESFKKIPFGDRAKPGEFEAILVLLKNEEQQAIERGEYELAIRWRDSRYKLEHGLDIYDLIHVVDQMRAEGKMGEYEALAKKYREEHHRLVPGQPDK